MTPEEEKEIIARLNRLERMHNLLPIERTSEDERERWRLHNEEGVSTNEARRLIDERVIDRLYNKERRGE